MKIRQFITAFLVLLSWCWLIKAQTTAFTYQGKLFDNSNPATGSYDLQFKLFDTVTVGTGTQQGNIVTVSNVTVSGGIFTVSLDFGACASCFNGAARFLEIAIKPSSGGTFTTLGPRQPITSTPYAIKSLIAANATSADGLSVACINCVTSSQIQSVNGSAVNGTIPVASVPAGSDNYIQNGTSQQAASNFNIDGDGTAGGTITGNIVNAVTQVNINGLRTLTVNGAFNDGFGTVYTATNTFTGEGAGVNTTPSGTLNNLNGKFNSFYGAGAGQANTTGFYNSFVGSQAGFSNTTACCNAFFGTSAGLLNTGQQNAFFGTSAGYANSTGFDNAFFGTSAGQFSSGSANTFVGTSAGYNNFADGNAFFGRSAGFQNTTGSQNAFFGTQAGRDNTTGSNNAFFGYQAGISNRESFNSFFGGGAGFANTTGSGNAFFGNGAGSSNTTGSGNTFIGTSSGLLNTTGGGNAFFGFLAGPTNTTGTYNTLLGYGADVGSGNLDHATAIGVGATVTASNQVQIGRMGFDTVSIGLLAAASSNHVCINGTVLSSCSSSLRYKESVQPFTQGLSLLQRLRPVSFNWKGRIEADLGLIAEEVAEVEPLLITHNQKGEIEGVKYDHLSVLFINAFKEQQTQIQQQQVQIKEQQSQIQRQQQQIELQHQQFKQQQHQLDALTKLVCRKIHKRTSVNK